MRFARPRTLSDPLGVAAEVLADRLRVRQVSVRLNVFLVKPGWQGKVGLSHLSWERWRIRTEQLWQLCRANLIEVW